MATRIINQAATNASEMLLDALKVHFEGSPAQPEFGWEEIVKHCTPDEPCKDAAHYLAVLNGDARVNGISRIAKVELPKEYGQGNGTGHGTKKGGVKLTQPQMELIFRLRRELGVTENDATRAFIANLTKAEASPMIDSLIEQAKAQRSAQRVQQADAKRRAERVELEAGIYLVDGTVYKVQKAIHGSGNMYAKVLVTDAPGVAHFDYAPGAIRKIRPENRMNLDQAKEYGAVYGVCCNCGRTLTDESSIEAGIGPVCSRKFA